jgi:hypothetical protein
MEENSFNLKGWKYIQLKKTHHFHTGGFHAVIERRWHTFGAMSVTAGVVGYPLKGAVIALLKMAA